MSCRSRRRAAGSGSGHGSAGPDRTAPTAPRPAASARGRRGAARPATTRSASAVPRAAALCAAGSCALPADLCDEAPARALEPPAAADEEESREQEAEPAAELVVDVAEIESEHGRRERRDSEIDSRAMRFAQSPDDEAESAGGVQDVGAQ